MRFVALCPRSRRQIPNLNSLETNPLIKSKPKPTPTQAVYSACYAPAKEIMQECYNEVRSGNEIRSVVMQGARLNEINTGKIDGTFTWKASFLTRINIRSINLTHAKVRLRRSMVCLPGQGWLLLLLAIRWRTYCFLNVLVLLFIPFPSRASLLVAPCYARVSLLCRSWPICSSCLGYPTDIDARTAGLDACC